MSRIIDKTNKVITELIDSIDNIKVPPIPTEAIYLADISHSGLDYDRLSRNILNELSKIRPEIPISTKTESGESSIFEQVIILTCKCLLEELKNNAKIEISVAPGVQSVVTATAAGVPVVGNATTLTFTKGVGIIS